MYVYIVFVCVSSILRNHKLVLKRYTNHIRFMWLKMIYLLLDYDVLPAFRKVSMKYNKPII